MPMFSVAFNKYAYLCALLNVFAGIYQSIFVLYDFEC